jgi:hypothetical protein
MTKGKYKSIESVSNRIKKDLDTPDPKKAKHTKISVLYACNASGKTRLSKLFYDKYKGKVLYYNAFTEDLFSWDNEDYALKFNKDAWIFQLIKKEGLYRQIIDNFQKFTGSKMEPLIDIPEDKDKPEGKIIFGIRSGDDAGSENIKISRGEESIFIWSVYFTVLENAISALNEVSENRSTAAFDKIQYIVIDDPVSSMDDTRIITVALELIKLIAKSNNQLKFLITTHHALFFNVLHTGGKNEKNWDRKNYVLSKSDTEFLLKSQGSESPFAYHHVAMAEIKKAKSDNDIKKYHFNIFRALLEKTANFLGYDHWKKCLEGGEHRDAFTKIIDHYSHNKLSDLEYRDLTNDEKKEFVEAFDFFIKKYDWGMKTNG